MDWRDKIGSFKQIDVRGIQSNFFQGIKKQAMQYKEGHDRYKEHTIVFQQNLKARLFTKEELQLIEKVQKMADKDLEERLKRRYIKLKDFKKIVG